MVSRVEGHIVAEPVRSRVGLRLLNGFEFDLCQIEPFDRGGEMVEFDLQTIFERDDVANFGDDASVYFRAEMRVGRSVQRKVVFFSGHHSASFICKDVVVILPANAHDGSRIQISLFNDVMRIGRLSSMTANDFYNACSIGYKACGYEDDGLSPIDQYYRHADGRDEGLSSRGQGVSSGPGIDPDSSDAWDEWFFDRERFGGHPWEVCRGGSFTHLSLFVMHDRDELEWKIQSTEISAEESEKHPNGYYFIVAGTHRIFEAVNFYTALRKAGLPVLLSSGNEILARLDGTDYVGIVSHNSTWRDFEEIIPESYEPVIDFMHVYNEEMEKFGNQIEWIPEEPARLIKK